MNAILLILIIFISIKPCGVKANHANSMTNTQSYAAMELDVLSKSSTDPKNRPIIEPFREEILSLCEKFGLSGQSGGSAPFTATAISQAIKKLLLQNPICPITGIDEEWVNVSEHSDGQKLWQNKRCSALFKNENGECWYLNAIVWKGEDSGCWSGSALLSNNGKYDTYYGRQYIKSFPFIPKTFYIDVIEVEEPKDDWTFYIKDRKQLDKVFKYYKRA